MPDDLSEDGGKRSRIELEVSIEGRETVLELLQALKGMGESGASAEIRVEKDVAGEVYHEGYWDGDGWDKIHRIDESTVEMQTEEPAEEGGVSDRIESFLSDPDDS